MIVSEFKSCTGCAACANGCPARAITMRENEAGYYHPVIDTEKCTNCELCEKICPEMTTVPFQIGKQKCFAVQADNGLRYVSSSGGAFSLIVEEWYGRYKGEEIYIAGAAFDGSWNVHHILINNLHDLDKLRRSKYVQSFVAEDFYRIIKELLQKGAFIVFSGVPCQVAGLRSFLQKDYENLLLVDLFCATISSPKIYRKFLEDNCAGEKITSVNFRSKIRGWTSSYTVITTEKHPEENFLTLFMKAYGLGLLKNEPCSHCRYHALHRQGDISIGDFWGIGKHFPHLDDSQGTSCVLTNTAKGEGIVQSFKKRCRIHKKLSTRKAVSHNGGLSGNFPQHKDIDIFNKQIDDLGFNETLSRIENHTYDVAVLGWIWNCNRGAILTNYALNKAITALGYHCQAINFTPVDVYKDYGLGRKFAEKRLSLTRRVNEETLASLNDEYGIFVVGSDQLWRWDFRIWPYGHMFLNFVDGKNRKISYATSFGPEVSFEGPEEQLRLRKLWLSRFDAISVRENEGVTYLKEEFGIEGTQVLDPVFLLDKNFYEKLADDSFRTEKNFIAYYFLCPNKAKMDIVEDVEKYYNIKSIDIAGNSSVESWLYYIKNCNILITDSFHGSCFATIFNKKFITIKNDDCELNRFKTLFLVTGMMNRFLYDASEFNRKKEILFQDIDWNEANVNLQKEIERSRTWLKNALKKDREEPYETAELLNIMNIDVERIQTGIKLKKEFSNLLNNKMITFINYWKYRICKNFIYKHRYTEKALMYKEKLQKLKVLSKTKGQI